MEFDIVTQNRYKPVDFVLPRTFHALPKHLCRAVYRAACDIVYTDEDPSTYLERSCHDHQRYDRDGTPTASWSGSAAEAGRSPCCAARRTMVGVLLARVYFDDPDPDEDAMARYNLNERTYYKYKKNLLRRR